MIFPRLSPNYIDEEHRDILQRMETFYSESITLNQAFWAEADIDTRFYAGEVALWSELYPNLPANRRRLFNFNRIRRIINMVSGHQRRTRKSMIAIPVENASQETADQFSKVLSSISDRENILKTISESFHGAMVSGMNLLHVWNDYRNDPLSGTLRVDNCSYNSFLIDPYFRKPDLSDCNGIWKRNYLTRREILSLMPDKEEEILSLKVNATGDDIKFQYMPENYSYSYNNLLSYDQFYYPTYRKAKMLVDTVTGETLEWQSEDMQALNDYLRMYPQVKVQDTQKRTIHVAIVVNGRVLYRGPNTLGVDRYPFVPMFCYYNSQVPYYYLRIQSMVRDLRDAQYLYARRKVIELDILESQVNSGWIYKENALVNPKDVFLSDQGRGIALKEEAQMTDVQRIEAPQIPPSMFQLSEQLAREIMEVSGVNEELLGSADDDKAGVLAMLRQGAGLTTLQPMFDQLDTTQEVLGRLLIEAVQVNYTAGKIQQLINEQPAPEFYNKNFGKFDCRVEDGLNTSTQKQMQFAQLLKMRELGIQIPDDVLIESSTLQNKNKLVEAIEQQQQAAQQQQEAQMQAQIQEQQARTELAQARAVADRGLGVERMSRVEENQMLAVERKAKAQEELAQARENRAQAQEDRAGALLDFIKALKELEQLDIVNLERLITLARVTSQEEERLRLEREPEENGLAALQGLQPQGPGS